MSGLLCTHQKSPFLVLFFSFMFVAHTLMNSLAVYMNSMFFFTIFRAVRLKYTIPGRPVLCWNSKPVIWVLSWDSGAALHFTGLCVHANTCLMNPSIASWDQLLGLTSPWVYIPWLIPHTAAKINHLTPVAGVSLISHLVSLIWLSALHIGFHIWLQRNLSLRFLRPGC